VRELRLGRGQRTRRMSEPSIGELYTLAQASFAELARSLTDDEWAQRVPCCPGWTVRDVLSHVAGVADDIVNGRVEGAATPPWTAAQVERYRDVPVDELLVGWAEQAPTIAGLLDAVGEGRPPFDCHVHEHDVRHAIGRPGNRDNAIIAVAAAGLARVGGEAPVAVVELDGRLPDGAVALEGGMPTVRRLTAFELVRSRIGRRSAPQVRAYDWSEPPDDGVLEAWFVFGPSSYAIAE
jgi:uncharacterized protein (TIGR03083 family)